MFKVKKEVKKLFNEYMIVLFLRLRASDDNNNLKISNIILQ